MLVLTAVLLLSTRAYADIKLDEFAWQVRPVLSGPELTVSSDEGSFLLHYTAEGDDTPTGIDDEDGNGLPQVVDRVLDGLSVGLEAYRERGFRELLPDDGSGGSSAIDVYIMGINANGFANADTAADPSAGHSCYMRLDKDLIAQGDQILESVVIHELHHCIQFVYTVDADPWLYEAASTYEQYQHIRTDVLDLAATTLWYFRLDRPDLPLGSEGERYEYAGMIFMKFWEELGGVDHSRGPQLWESLAAEPVWRRALDAESRRQWGLDFDSLFLEFSTWNLFACGNDDGAHYGADVLPCAAPANPIPVTEIDWTDPIIGVEEQRITHTAAYYSLPGAGDTSPVSLACSALDPGTQALVRLVAIDRNGRAIAEASITGGSDEQFRVRLDHQIDGQGSVAVVVASTGALPADFNCRAKRVDPIDQDQGATCRHTPPSQSAAAGLILLALLLYRRSTNSPVFP